MEFEEMQKIWIASRQETIYAINEKALYNIIDSKRKKALHIASISELLLIIVHLCSACFIIAITFWNSRNYPIMYVMAGWLFITAVYVLISRIQRFKQLNIFSRSLLEDLKQAVFTAGYQVQLSHIMRLNIFPVALLCILGILNKGVSWWFALATGLFFVIAYYFSGWEHNYYKNKKRELEILQIKLEEEE